MTLAWLHTIDPVVLKFTDALAVRWYGLAYLLGFLVGWWVLRLMSRRGLTPLSPQRIADVMLAMVVGVVVGGRLGYILFYQPGLLTDFGSAFPWWGVLKINQGGMASHGGMIGVTIACWIVSRGVKDESGARRERVPFLHVIDLMVLTAPFGIFFGRIANFINGELLGRIVAMPCEPAPWWAVKFPQELLSGHDPGNPELHLMSREAASAREAALEQVLAQVRLPSDTHDQAVHRLIEKIQHGSHELAAQLEPLISARAPSQLLQAAAEGILIGAIVWLIWRVPRTPGVITAWGLILYGVLRVSTEFVRLPDAGLDPFLGLSRGQWLSAPMVVGGIVLLVFVVKRNGQKFGGWGARPSANTHS